MGKAVFLDHHAIGLVKQVDPALMSVKTRYQQGLIHDIAKHKLIADNHSHQLRTDLGTKPRIYYLHVTRAGEEVT